MHCAHAAYFTLRGDFAQSKSPARAALCHELLPLSFSPPCSTKSPKSLSFFGFKDCSLRVRLSCVQDKGEDSFECTSAAICRRHFWKESKDPSYCSSFAVHLSALPHHRRRPTACLADSLLSRERVWNPGSKASSQAKEHPGRKVYALYIRMFCSLTYFTGDWGSRRV